MKKLILFCLFLAAVPIIAQNSGQYTSVRSGLALPSTCDQTKGPIFLLQNDGLYQGVGSPCNWQKVSAGGGGGGLTGVITVTSTIQNAVTSAGTNQGVVIPPTYTGTDTFLNSNNRPILDLRRLGDFRGGRISVLDYGADPGAGYYQGANMASGSAIATNVYLPVSLSAGTRFCVSGAGVAGADLCGTIVSVSGSTPGFVSVTTSVTASTSVTGRGAYWGKDSTAAFQAAMSLCSSPTYSYGRGCQIDVPLGAYLLSSTINVPSVSVYSDGRVNVSCMGGGGVGAGHGGTQLIWTGADQTAMFLAPSNSLPFEMSGCTPSSADSNNYPSNAGTRAAIGVLIQGGTRHRFIDNHFGVLYDGIKLSNTWLNLIDHNVFYGPYHSAIYAPSGANGGLGPLNGTTISNNEFGLYHLHGYFNESNGSGGSNGNFNFGNDYEGTSTDTIADVDDNSGWDTFGPNRFETGGSTVVGYSPLILRGSGKSIYVTFCAGIQVLGSDNTINCANAANGTVTDAGFNTWTGEVTRAASGIAASSMIAQGSYRTGTFLDTNSRVDLMGGVSGTAVDSPQITLNGRKFRTAVATETNPNLPSCSSPTAYVRGETVFNRYADQSVAIDKVFGWMCMNAAGCSCPASTSDWVEFGQLSSRTIRECTSVPTTGQWNAGDFCRNITPSGSSPIYGWMNTVGGTPGTFVALQAINPASPPNWGTTTPATGAFSTLSTTGPANFGANATTTGVATDATHTTNFTAIPLTSIAGCAHYYKASTIAQADGSAVASWTDSCGSATITGTGTQQPTYKTNIINGQPVVRFNGTTNILQLSSGVTHASNYTACVLYQKAVGTPTSAKYIMTADSGAQTSIGFNNATTARVLKGGTALTATFGDTGAFSLFCVNFNGASSSIYQDGTSKATGTVGTGTASAISIGGLLTGGAYIAADIGEYIEFDHVLSASDFALVNYYYSQTYALSNASLPTPQQVTVSGTPVAYTDINGKNFSNGTGEGFQTVTFSATPTFDFKSANTVKITLTGNVTSSTLANAVAGQPLNFIICQDATGSRTLAWPANVFGEGTITATANKCSSQSFKFDGTNAYATGPMVDQDANVSAATYKAGSNNVTQTIASGTATLGSSAIASGTCDTVVTVAATGVATTDTITFSPNTDPTAVTGYTPSASGSLYIWPYPTANNVNFKVCNNTAGSITPTALTLNWRVSR